VTTLEVAVVGSGPAGIYTAEALIKQVTALAPPGTVRVDVLDRLPTPYGLVRYGVAPDHPSIRSIADYLRGVLEHPAVRFLGGVHLGDDVTREDLLASYDAVVYATGAMRDRRMGIPGEDLPGSYAATDFVNWYCGHPDSAAEAFTLDAESVAVVGVGNVAVDVARILVKDPAALRSTDIPHAVLEALTSSKVREVHMIGRRGPAQAKFTTKELRELGELADVDIEVRPAELDLDAFDPTGQSAQLAQSDRRVRGNLAAMRDWAARPSRGAARRLTVRFWLRPAAVEGTVAEGTVAEGTAVQGRERVSGLTVERTRLDEQGRFTGTGEYETIPAQMVFRSVGYQSVPLAGVPFDESSATVPNAEGRVLGPDGEPLPGEYVAGWLKRGPTGVVGTNKSDAAATVRSLLADLAARGPGETGGPGEARGPGETRGPGGRPSRRPLTEVLAARGVRPVSYVDWLRIEAAEAELAGALGRGERVKIGDREAIEALCRPSAG